MTVKDIGVEAGTGGSVKYEQIMVAASQLFLNNGFAGASMDAISRAAGVSKATIYAHFGSKEDLFEAMVARGSSQRFSHLLDADLDRLDVEAALRVVAREFVDVLTSAESLKTLRAVMAEAGRLPELAARFYRAGPGRVLAALTAYIGRANARGEIEVDDPRTAAELFVGMIRGDLHIRRMLGLADHPDMADSTRQADAAVDLFLKACRRRP